MPRSARSSRRDISIGKSDRLRRLVAGGAVTAKSVAAIEQGLPISVLSELRELLREDEIERLVIPRRTLAHRRLKGEPLSAEESDRALRVARVAEPATATLGKSDGLAEARTSSPGRPQTARSLPNRSRRSAYREHAGTHRLG